MRITIDEKNKVREQLTYSEIFCLFMIGSVIGFVLEGLWHMLTVGGWESHVATVWGPFCIIYGIATVMLYALSLKLKTKNAVLRFFIYAVVSASIEYFISLFQEICFGSVSWDYSDHFLNVNGRTSLQMCLLWGVLGILFDCLVFPLFARFLRNMQGRPFHVACGILSAIMAADLIVTSSAVTRWRERTNDIPTANAWEEYLDAVYSDERMSEIFPNMEFLD